MYALKAFELAFSIYWHQNVQKKRDLALTLLMRDEFIRVDKRNTLCEEGRHQFRVVRDVLTKNRNNERKEP